MFESTLESTRPERVFHAGPVAMAAMLHLAVLGGVLAASWWVLRPVQGPPIVIAGPQIQLDPPPGDGGDRSSAPPPPKRREPARPPDQPQLQPPVVTPDRPPAVVPPTSENDDGDLPFLSEDGVPGGTGPAGSGGPGIGGPGGGGPPGGTDVDSEAAPRRLTPDMKIPRLIKKVEPAYPDIPRKARLSGNVGLEIVVGPDGSVEDVRVKHASSPMFVASAIQAVRQWRYTPAEQSGVPVRVYIDVEITFVLR